MIRDAPLSHFANRSFSFFASGSSTSTWATAAVRLVPLVPFGAIVTGEVGAKSQVVCLGRNGYSSGKGLGLWSWRKKRSEKRKKKDVSHSTLSPVMFHGPYPFSDFVMNPSILRDIYLECILVASSGNNHITCTPGLSLWLAPKTWTHPTTYTSVWILGSM